MTISEEDRALIRKFDDIRKRGLYCKSSQLQAVYNRVFKVNLSATTCGSCLRERTKKLVDALNRLEAEEARKKQLEEQEKEIIEERKEENKDGSKGAPPKTKGRKKGKK